MIIGAIRLQREFPQAEIRHICIDHQLQWARLDAFYVHDFSVFRLKLVRFGGLNACLPSEERNSFLINLGLGSVPSKRASVNKAFDVTSIDIRMQYVGLPNKDAASCGPSLTSTLITYGTVRSGN